MNFYKETLLHYRKLLLPTDRDFTLLREHKTVKLL